MGKKSKLTKASVKNRSVFNYSLKLGPDGNVNLFDKRGKPLKKEGTRRPPRIKRILNVRTLTISEAEGSKWIYIKPPGVWYQLT